LGTRNILALVLVCIFGLGCAGAFCEEPKPVEVHGYMLNRMYAATGSNPEFRSERISLSVIGNLPQNRNAYLEWYYHPWASGSGLYQESAYFDTPLGDGRLRVGKGRGITFGMTASYPNRKTTNYGIVSEAFTQDRIQGLQWYMQKGTLDLSAAIRSSLRLGTRSVGELSGDTVRNASHTVPHLCFRDLTDQLSRKTEMVVRVGGKWPSGINAGLSYLVGSIDQRDVVNLSTSSASNPLTPGGTPALIPGAQSNDKKVLALDGVYKSKSGFVCQGELYDASISDLDYDAWCLLVGWEPAGKWRFYARYGEQNMDVTPSANPLSWDIRQISLSAVQPLGKTTWLQYEYEINSEDVPAGVNSVSNNLFFIELFSGF